MIFWCNTHRNEHVRTSVFPWGLGPKVPVFEGKTELFALERTATVIGLKMNGEAYFSFCQIKLWVFCICINLTIILGMVFNTQAKTLRNIARL
jgi:hypothetical protein